MSDEVKIGGAYDRPSRWPGSGSTQRFFVGRGNAPWPPRTYFNAPPEEKPQEKRRQALEAAARGEVPLSWALQQGRDEPPEERAEPKPWALHWSLLPRRRDPRVSVTSEPADFSGVRNTAPPGRR